MENKEIILVNAAVRQSVALASNAAPVHVALLSPSRKLGTMCPHVGQQTGHVGTADLLGIKGAELREQQARMALPSDRPFPVRMVEEVKPEEIALFGGNAENDPIKASAAAFQGEQAEQASGRVDGVWRTLNIPPQRRFKLSLGLPRETGVRSPRQPNHVVGFLGRECQGAGESEHRALGDLHVTRLFQPRQPSSTHAGKHPEFLPPQPWRAPAAMGREAGRDGRSRLPPGAHKDSKLTASCQVRVRRWLVHRIPG